MMKNRSFMLGLGCGLIAGAVLLQVVISGGAAPLTKDQVVKGAANLNLKVVDKSAKLLTAEEWEAGKEKREESELSGDPAGAAASSEPSAAASPAVAATPEVAVEPDKAVTPAQPVKPSLPDKEGIQKPSEPSAQAVTVPPAVPDVSGGGEIQLRIPNGATLAETANLLAKAGVVKDKDAFLKAANKRKINTIIQYGSYSFDEEESVDSVIDKLITLKK